MTHAPFQWENFSKPSPSAVPVEDAMSNAVSEDEITAITEKAYRDGWDDCLRNMNDNEQRVSEALGLRLSEIQLSQQSIRDKVNADTHHFLTEMLDKVLPRIAQASFKHHLMDLIRTHTLEIGMQPAELCVSEDDLPAVEAFLGQSTDLPPLVVQSDPAMGMTQARLTLGDTAKTIDIMEMIDEIDAALGDAPQTEKAISNG